VYGNLFMTIHEYEGIIFLYKTDITSYIFSRTYLCMQTFLWQYTNTKELYFCIKHILYNYQLYFFQNLFVHGNIFMTIHEHEWTIFLYKTDITNYIFSRTYLCMETCSWQYTNTKELYFCIKQILPVIYFFPELICVWEPFHDNTDITSYILFPELIFVWEPFHDNTRLMILEVNLSWGLVLTVLQSDIRVC